MNNQLDFELTVKSVQIDGQWYVETTEGRVGQLQQWTQYGPMDEFQISEVIRSLRTDFQRFFADLNKKARRGLLLPCGGAFKFDLADKDWFTVRTGQIIPPVYTNPRWLESCFIRPENSAREENQKAPSRHGFGATE